VDGPGVFDNILRNDYANQTGVKFVLNKCKIFSLTVIMNTNEIFAKGGISIIELLTAILRKYKN